MNKLNLIGCYPSFARAYEIALLGDFNYNICVDTTLAESDFITELENAKLLKKTYPLFGLHATIYLEINKLDYSRIITSNKSETILDINERVQLKKSNKRPTFEFTINTELLKRLYTNTNISLKDFEETLIISEVIAQFEGTSTIELSHIAEACIYKSLASESYLRSNIDDKAKYVII